MQRREGDVAVFDAVLGDEFSPRPELVFLPVRVVEVFVELDDRAGAEPVLHQREHVARRGIDVAIHVEEADRIGMGGFPDRDRVAEPAFVELDIPRHFRKRAAPVEGAGGLGVARPVFRQALETVEAVNRALVDGGDLGDRSAIGDAEFQHRALRRILHAIFQHLGRVFEDDRVGHMRFRVIRRLRARAHLQFVENVAGEIFVIEAADEPFRK